MLSHPGRTLTDQLRSITKNPTTDRLDIAFEADLRAGKLTREALAALARQLHVVYSALEQHTAASAQDPVFSRFHHPGLNRVPRLEKDLDYLATDMWPERTMILPATVTYAARIHKVGSNVPALIAHHYTRYLNDLTGCHTVARVLASSLGVSVGHPGTSFFDFSAVSPLQQFRDRYRESLDSTAWRKVDDVAVVREAARAHDLSAGMLAELAVVFPPTQAARTA